MLRYLSILTALAEFGAGSLKTMCNDATKSADAAARGKFDDDDRPDRNALATYAQSKACAPDDAIVEPTLHDDDFPHVRDEKAASFAIACYLAQQ